MKDRFGRVPPHVPLLIVLALLTVLLGLLR